MVNISQLHVNIGQLRALGPERKEEKRMASLLNVVKEYQEDLCAGLVWLVFYWDKDFQWGAEYFCLKDGYLCPETESRLEEIREKDPAAIVVSGYLSGRSKNMSLDELTAWVRYRYKNGLCNIGAFIEDYSCRLSPKEIEKGRAAASMSGLPFSEKPYCSVDDFNPYIFDGSMSMEDCKLMGELMKEDEELLVHISQ